MSARSQGNPAFQGHGLFCYLPQETVRHFDGYGRSAGRPERLWPLLANLRPADPAGALAAFKDMNISHVWIRLFGHEGQMPPHQARPLIETLRDSGVALAGWGYSHGANWRHDLRWAIEGCRELGLDAFVADIEPGRSLGGTRSTWRRADLKSYIDGLVQEFGKTNIGISTWPILRIQNEEGVGSLNLMRAIADKIAFFAPQAYWMSFPKQVHYATTGLREAEFPRDDASSFVRMVIRSWRDEGFSNDLLVTGQAYWGEGSSPPQSVMERKIVDFAQKFDRWNDIIGLNWWHAGGRFAMSPTMTQAIVNGRFDARPYRKPTIPQH